MSSETHPEFETLLLWQTGELEPDQVREVQRHIASCASCREKLDKLDDLYSEGDWANALVAERSMHVRLTSEKNRSRWIRNSWPAAVAAGLIVAVLLYTTEFTPSAQAETLLNRAITRESETAFHPHVLRIGAGSQNCNVAFAEPDMPVIQTETSGASICGDIDRQLHSAGWNWSTALSAKGFEHWRASLPRKHDAIYKTSDFTEVSTRTDDGPIHEATLRLRNTDYAAVAARVQFTSDGVDSSVEIEETPYTPPVETASAPIMAHTPVMSHDVTEPSLSPLDRSEAEVRLALHRIGADTNILLATNRQADAIHVWGVAPTPDAKASIVQSLANIPNVSLAVVTAAEQQASQSPLPWQAAHSGAPPLAYEQVNDLFKNNDESRQKFLNDLDAITRRILGEAKARDALLKLATHDRTSDDGVPLRSAADDLQIKLLADQRLLVERLSPVYAAFQQPLPKQPSPLSYEQAMEVYLLIHRLFIADDSGGTMTAEAAFGKLGKQPL